MVYLIFREGEKMAAQNMQKKLAELDLEGQIALVDEVYRGKESYEEKRKEFESIVEGTDYVDVTYHAARAIAALALKAPAPEQVGAEGAVPGPVRSRRLEATPFAGLKRADLPGFVREYIADVEARLQEGSE